MYLYRLGVWDKEVGEWLEVEEAQCGYNESHDEEVWTRKRRTY